MPIVGMQFFQLAVEGVNVGSREFICRRLGLPGHSVWREDRLRVSDRVEGSWLRLESSKKLETPCVVSSFFNRFLADFSFALFAVDASGVSSDSRLNKAVEGHLTPRRSRIRVYSWLSVVQIFRMFRPGLLLIKT
jgi:hypothetical protein